MVCSIAILSKKVSCNVIQNNEVFFDINRFSSFSKLIGVTKVIYSFLKFDNPVEKSKVFWIKRMQDECFSTEINYLLNKDKLKLQTVPPLVRDLDLFLDSKGILRTKGRIGKTINYSFEVINPIMLGKKHKLTDRN